MRDWVNRSWAGILLWLSENSLNRHLATLPFGALVTTWILLGITGAGAQWWSKPADLIAAGQAVPFGAVLYSTIVLLLDGGVKLVFFALAQRKNEIERRHLEGRRQLLRELINKGVTLPPELRKEAEQLGVLVPVPYQD